MAKGEVSPETKEKKRRINKEIKRLSDVLREVPEETFQAADGLINRAAFMRVTLEDYEADLTENGHTEMFSQSEKTEPYERERPVARLYNSMVKNYTTTLVKLFDLIPNKANNDPVDPAYEKFFGKGK